MTDRRRNLTAPETTEVCNGLMKARGAIEHMTTAEIANHLRRAGCKVGFSHDQLRRLLKECDLPYRKHGRGGSQTHSPGQDKLVVLAKAVRELARALGHTLTVGKELDSIVARKALPQPASLAPTSRPAETNGTANGCAAQAQLPLGTTN